MVGAYLRECYNMIMYIGYPTPDRIKSLKATKDPNYKNLSLLGSDGYLEQTELLNYDFSNKLIEEYVIHDIHDLYHLSLNEYMSKTIYEQMVLINNSILLKKRKELEQSQHKEELEKLEKELNDG